MSEVFRSERDFKVWTYSVTHCRLLLRATKEGGLLSRIDLYFAGIDRMVLRPYYCGIRIGIADDLEIAEYQRRFGPLPPRSTLFTLEPDLASFVVAAIMQSHEDEGGFQDPSVFGRFD
jgi:hypothetical protein